LLCDLSQIIRPNLPRIGTLSFCAFCRMREQISVIAVNVTANDTMLRILFFVQNSQTSTSQLLSCYLNVNTLVQGSKRLYRCSLLWGDSDCPDSCAGSIGGYSGRTSYVSSISCE
jgi:hypothetical protein